MNFLWYPLIFLNGYKPSLRKWLFLLLVISLAGLQFCGVIALKASNAPVKPESDEVKAIFAEWDEQWAAYELAKEKDPDLTLEEFLGE